METNIQIKWNETTVDVIKSCRTQHLHGATAEMLCQKQIKIKMIQLELKQVHKSKTKKVIVLQYTLRTYCESPVANAGTLGRTTDATLFYFLSQINLYSSQSQGFYSEILDMF